MPVRPQRAAGLTAPSVGIVLRSSGTQTVLMNSYLTAAHLALGILVMTLGLEDILKGGPTRPTIIPVAGAYMACAVVLYTLMREKRPTVLAWTLVLADVVMLTAVYNLTIINLVGGPEITLALIAGAVFTLYGAYGNPRMILAAVALTALMFAATAPPLQSAVSGRLESVQPDDLGAFVLMAGASLMAYRIASIKRARSALRAIVRLQRIDHTVSMYRTATSLGDG